MPDTTPNLRDLGGIVTGGGGTIRSGLLLRSALPFEDDLAPGDVVWPPGIVVDLRSDGERSQHPSLSGPQVVHAPLLSQLKPDAHLDGTLVALYRALLDAAPGLLVDVVRTVAEADDAPVLLHCAAGKDRTGIAAALILRLLEVDRDVVMDDYVATNQNIDAIDRRLRALAGNEKRDELPREYFHVVPEALDGVLDVWDGHRGGVRGWLTAAGADAELFDRLEQRLVW